MASENYCCICGRQLKRSKVIGPVCKRKLKMAERLKEEFDKRQPSKYSEILKADEEFEMFATNEAEADD